MGVCERGRERVCVCEREASRERERECVCERERERERERETAFVFGQIYLVFELMTIFAFFSLRVKYF